MPRWTSAQWQQLVSHVAYNNELGVEFSELVPTGVVLRIRYRPELATSVDDETLNDGAIVSMVDAALGFSVHWAMPDDRSLATLDMRIDFPIAGALIAGGRDLLLVGQAGAVGAVDLGARQGLDREAHHDHVDRDHDAEERDKHEKHPASGERLWRAGPAHVKTPLGRHGDTK